jgi:hypothetical protein
VSHLDRIESVKAGVIGAIAFTVAYGCAIVVNHYTLITTTLDFSCLGKVVIAAMSGFLFAVTYRYIIRSDQNSHLKDGAVLAFGLVRGLAIGDNGSYFNDNWTVFSLLIIESIVCFTAARLCLDMALKQGWIEPFSG